MYNAMQGDVDKVKEIRDKPVKLGGIITVPQMMDQGEMAGPREVNKTYLCLADGSVWLTFADGIYESVRALIAVFGNPPWEPPLTAIVRERETNNGRRMYYIELTK